jgi:hypothetical protein
VPRARRRVGNEQKIDLRQRQAWASGQLVGAGQTCLERAAGCDLRIFRLARVE